MKSQVIPIVFSVNEGYAKYLSVAIKSIMNCANFDFEYKIYVLYTDLEEKTIRTLQNLGSSNVQIIFIEVSKEWGRISKYIVMQNATEEGPCRHISKETFFHIFITKYLPEHELVIYSDCDVIFLKDPAILLCEVRKNKDSAVVYGVINFSSIGTKKYIEDRLGLASNKYINAGIFVLNVQQAIKKQFPEKCEALIPRSSEFVMMDQDMINIALSEITDGIRLLDAHWNFQWHPLDKSQLNLCCSVKNDFLGACSDPFAIHYTSASKPWKKPYKPFAELFWKNAQNSPYYSAMKEEIEDCGPVVLSSNKCERKEHPKVSVIIPVYNEEKLLTRCLNSICNQSLTDMEIICVDDGSTDGSADVMKEYMKSDSRIQVICQNNNGAGEARNTGIRYASGEYLYFVDADDYLEENTLESIVSCADSAKADVVIFDVFHIDEDKTISYPITYILPQYSAKDIFSPKEACDYLFMLTGGCVWNKLYRANYIHGNGMLFQQLKGADDVYFSMLSLAFADCIALCKKRLIYHTINKSDSQMSMLEHYPLNQSKALLSVKRVLIEYGLYELFERSFVNRSAQNSIKNLSRINKYSVFLSAYEEYRLTLFQKLGIIDKSKEYFFRKELYDDVCFILDNECNENVFDVRKAFLSVSKRKKRP